MTKANRLAHLIKTSETYWSPYIVQILLKLKQNVTHEQLLDNHLSDYTFFYHN